MTPQGKAIAGASAAFGDGTTLPFCPCKRGYVPLVAVGNGKRRMVACSFHEKARRKRLAREGDKLRGGEADPEALFWSIEIPQRDGADASGNAKATKKPKTTIDGDNLPSATTQSKQFTAA